MRSVVLPLTIISSIALAALFGWKKMLMGDINQYNPPSYSDMNCTFTAGNSNITYNFAPIAAMGQILAPDQDSSEITYYFQICANLTSNHSCSDYDPGIGCAQQWIDGQCVYWLAEWDNNDAQISFANYSDPFAGLTIEFDNGETCYSEFGVVYPYKSKFLFLCDESTDLKVLPGYINQHDKCLYEFPLRSKYACAPLTCTFTPNGSIATYDLTPIARMGQISAPDAVNSALSYHLQVCADLSTGIGCAQQWEGEQYELWLAQWDNNNAIIGLVNASNPSSGLTIEFDNGEKCYSQFGVTYPYKSRFIFLCDNSTNLKVLPGYQNSYDKCLYEFTLLSKYACVETHSECIWMTSDGNHMLDMSSIIGKQLKIVEANTSDSYYMYTPCRNTWRCDNDTYAMAYIFDDMTNECTKYLAVYEDGINEPNYNEELKTWQFVFTNGERCDGFENVFTVQWVCDKAAKETLVVKAVEMITCNYLLVVNSTLACN